MTEKKPPEQEGTRPGPRECLRCHKWFPSEGIHNRICLYCHNKAPYRGLDELSVGNLQLHDHFSISDMKISPVSPSQ